MIKLQWKTQTLFDWIQAIASIAPCLLVTELASPICGITSVMTN